MFRWQGSTKHKFTVAAAQIMFRPPSALAIEVDSRIENLMRKKGKTSGDGLDCVELDGQFRTSESPDFASTRLASIHNRGEMWLCTCFLRWEAVLLLDENLARSESHQLS